DVASMHQTDRQVSEIRRCLSDVRVARGVCKDISSLVCGLVPAGGRGSSGADGGVSIWEDSGVEVSTSGEDVSGVLEAMDELVAYEPEADRQANLVRGLAKLRSIVQGGGGRGGGGVAGVLDRIGQISTGTLYGSGGVRNSVGEEQEDNVAQDGAGSIMKGSSLGDLIAEELDEGKVAGESVGFGDVTQSRGGSMKQSRGNLGAATS
ncbi:hypothetical protein HK104_005681, partial [Borealophlyctis nickersoniae]